jgi:DedD protein
MALLKFLRRPGTATDAASSGAATATGLAGSSAALAVQAARDQARRRLLGAVVLLGIGIIGLPLVFQTQPRPLPVDIPIDIPNREQAPPLGSASSAGSAGSAGTTGAAATSGAGGDTAKPAAKPLPSAPAPATAPTPAAAALQQPPVEPASPPAATAVAAATPSPPGSVEVEVLPPSKGERAKDSDKDRGRFIVQAGSYTDLDTVREVRQKLERMGIKTYTQAAVIEGVTRVRVRVGPFSSRQEAQEVQAKIKAAGVAASLLQL